MSDAARPPVELVHEFSTGQARWIIQLNYPNVGPDVVEAEVLRNERLWMKWTWPTRGRALLWADEQRRQILRG